LPDGDPSLLGIGTQGAAGPGDRDQVLATCGENGEGPLIVLLQRGGAASAPPPAPAAVDDFGDGHEGDHQRLAHEPLEHWRRQAPLEQLGGGVSVQDDDRQG
jgi:hypothetical protein